MNTIRKTRYTEPLKAAVFDWAGTAVDYGCMAPVVAFREVFRSRYVEPTLDEVRSPMGLDKLQHLRAMCAMPRLRDLWKAIYNQAPDEEDVQGMFRELSESMARHVRDHAAPVPGFLDVVAALRGMGLCIGSTSGYGASIMAILRKEAARLGYRPDCVVCASDVPAGRPYPWMCLRNAIELGVFPMEAMVKVGDTVNDVFEGLNAGMWTVAMSTSGNEMGLSLAEVSALAPDDLASRRRAVAQRLRGAGAHYVLSDIRGLPAVVEDINRLLAQGWRPCDVDPFPDDFTPATAHGHLEA